MPELEVPKVVDKSTSEIDSIIAEINASSLSDSTKKFCILCIRSACWFPKILEKKNISLSRLRAMIFGKKKKSSSSNSGGNNGEPGNNNGSNEPTDTSGDKQQGLDEQSNASSNNQSSPPKAPKQGKNNGRNSHEVYENATLAWHGFSDLKPGAPCPNEFCSGKLSVLPAGIVVRIDGQAMASVTKHIIEKLRCGLCLEVFKAPTPEALTGKQKIYTPLFVAQLALHKFYLGVPYHRLDSYHQILNCPLPDSTQWDLIERLGGDCYSVFHVLVRLSANGLLVQNDDTVARILSLLKENKQAQASSRQGSFTTCVIGAYETHPIALYFNGRNHSGENLDKLLAHRDKDKASILQMSDALAANTPKTIATTACYCLSHGFRKFDELAEFFPTPCLAIMEQLSLVFANDKQTQGMSADERLAYHQQHSAPILHALYHDIERYLAEPKIEPNSELAKALKYFKKHWVPLTRFLSVPGALLDNNLCERAIKVVIRHRRNSLFFRTFLGAEVGDGFMSLIHTAVMAGIDAFDYLNTLQIYDREVALAPEQWLPWCYQETLATTLTVRQAA